MISTGGTIACHTNAAGALVPHLTAADLVAASKTEVATRPRDMTSVDSSSMTLADLDRLVDTVHEELAAPSTAGVVVTHGTDSLAETAFTLDLFHTDPRPVVVTGAQRSADAIDPDGPANVKDAIELAAAGHLLNKGVIVSFGGRDLPARGLVKRDISALDAFANTWELPVIRPDSIAPVALEGMNIPILRAWAGATGDVVHAALATQPHGIVVEALGAGNVSDHMGNALAEVLDAGVPVVITTSVPFGAVKFAYGGSGGGHTLGDRGAIASGWLRAGQARIALATALSAGVDPRILIGG